jgi:hypothetical protein
VLSPVAHPVALRPVPYNESVVETKRSVGSLARTSSRFSTASLPNKAEDPGEQPGVFGFVETKRIELSTPALQKQ